MTMIEFRRTACVAQVGTSAAPVGVSISQSRAPFRVSSHVSKSSLYHDHMAQTSKVQNSNGSHKEVKSCSPKVMIQGEMRRGNDDNDTASARFKVKCNPFRICCTNYLNTVCSVHIFLKLCDSQLESSLQGPNISRCWEDTRIRSVKGHKGDPVILQIGMEFGVKNVKRNSSSTSHKADQSSQAHKKIPNVSPRVHCKEHCMNNKIFQPGEQ